MPFLHRLAALLSIGLAVFSLAACGPTVNTEGLPTGAAAYTVIPSQGIPAPTGYLLQPQDVLDLKVFDEPQISNDKLRIDDGGFIQVPFAGQIKASDRTAVDVGNEIRNKLGASYLRNPQVTLALAEPTPRYVSVEGEVLKAGVYELTKDTTLLSAIARAGSTTPLAKLDEVVILRTINGQQMAARFDIKDIRGGVQPDPIVLNNDVVVVGRSGSRSFLDGFLKAGGLISSVFYAVQRRGNGG